MLAFFQERGDSLKDGMKVHVVKPNQNSSSLAEN